MTRDNSYIVMKLLIFVINIICIHLMPNYCFLSVADSIRLQSYDSEQRFCDVIAFGFSDCLNSFDTKVESEALVKSVFNYGVHGATLFDAIQGAFDNTMSSQHPDTVSHEH